jgi:hypothetical protein
MFGSVVFFIGMTHTYIKDTTHTYIKDMTHTYIKEPRLGGGGGGGGLIE